VKTYHLTTVNELATFVSTTDDQLIKRLLQDLGTYVRNPKTRREVKSLDTKQLIECGFHDLDKRDAQVSRWIRKWLCEHSWEPFAVTSVTDRTGQHLSNQYHFRRELQG